MQQQNRDLIQGTLDMLILKALSLEPMHGFGIARRIEQISRGVFKVNSGSLLTAFQRLERMGWLDSEWRVSDNSRRAKSYSLTRSGRKQLDLETASWNRRASAIARLLKAEGSTRSFWRQLTRGLRVLRDRDAADAAIGDELGHYLEEATREGLAHGLSPQEARRRARLEIGSS